MARFSIPVVIGECPRLEYNDRWLIVWRCFLVRMPLKRKLEYKRSYRVGMRVSWCWTRYLACLIGVFDLLMVGYRRDQACQNCLLVKKPSWSVHQIMYVLYYLYYSRSILWLFFLALSGLRSSWIPTRNTSQFHTHIRGGAPWNHATEKVIFDVHYDGWGGFCPSTL